MTEKEAWLKSARKCILARDSCFLCHEVKHRRLNLRPQMKERLWLFRPDPDSDCGLPWWWYGYGDDCKDLTEANECRATACCFLAAMCDTVTPKRRGKGS